MNLLNIITPCSRPENLKLISETIPKENCRWIIVFDSNSVLTKEYGESYCVKNLESVFGNAQRNYALDLVKDGWIYFNDDDTVVHENLWEEIKNLNNDFISFSQKFKNGHLRLIGDNVSLNNIDSHNFVVHHSLTQSTRWDLKRYDADGVFAEECYKKSKTPIFIPKTLSIYNLLKP